MGLSDDLDAFLGDAGDDAARDMHEQMAQGLAQQLRDAGQDTADDVELVPETDSDDPAYAIDVEWVRRRANELLKE